MSAGNDFYRQAIEVWNGHDIGRWVALGADDIVVAASGGFSAKGPDGNRQFAQIWQEAFSDCRVTIRKSVAEGDWVMGEGTFAGTHDGPLPTPAGDVIPPTGKRVSVEYMEVWETRGSKATYHRVYFDELELLAQLGISPGA